MEVTMVSTHDRHYNCSECNVHFTVSLFKSDIRKISCPVCGKPCEESILNPHNLR